jgi:hypothetical protein
MIVVKAKNAIAEKACKAKKLAKLVMVVELGFTKLRGTLQGEKKKISKPFNLDNGESGASMEKESSKGEASKDNI